jgi:hypothetical protein
MKVMSMFVILIGMDIRDSVQRRKYRRWRWQRTFVVRILRRLFENGFHMVTHMDGIGNTCDEDNEAAVPL